MREFLRHLFPVQLREAEKLSLEGLSVRIVTVNNRCLFFLLVTVIFISRPASADPGVVDQVERLEISKGEIELELQSVLVPSQSRYSASYGGGVTVEFGVSGEFGLGSEVEYEVADGDAEIEEVALQAKWIAVDPETADFGLGVQIGAGYDIEDARFAVEATAIVEVQRPNWIATANVILRALPGERDGEELSYAARADRRLGDDVLIGVEAGGALMSNDPRGHWIGPVLSYSANENMSGVPHIDIGVFTGLNRNSPGFQARVELDWEF